MESDKSNPGSVDDRQLELVARLRNIALQQMRKTGYSAQFHTLQKTEVANEIFDDSVVIERFNSLTSKPAEEINREEIDNFIRLCTIKIKHYLIDYMRRKFADKRGGNLHFVSLDESLDIFADLNIKDYQIEYLNDALAKLEAESPFHAQLINDKYFLGMKNQELAAQYDVSLSKIEKDSHFAIAWLKRELSK